MTYKSFEPNKCSQKNFLALAFENYIGPFLMKTPSKVGTRSLQALPREKKITIEYTVNQLLFATKKIS